MSMALNDVKGIHSVEYTKAVWKRLRDAEEAVRKAGGTAAQKAEAVKDALKEMRDIMEEGDTFWKY